MTIKASGSFYRRELVSGVGAGLATLATLRCSSASTGDGASIGAEAAALLQDPKTKYPRPPFPSQ